MSDTKTQKVDYAWKKFFWGHFCGSNMTQFYCENRAVGILPPVPVCAECAVATLNAEKSAGFEGEPFQPFIWKTDIKTKLTFAEVWAEKDAYNAQLTSTGNTDDTKDK